MKFQFLLTIGMSTALILGSFCPLAGAAIMSALTSTNSLVTFNSAAPGAILNTVSVTGLTLGDSLVAIDYRPIDGQLVGFGYNSGTGTARVYSINALGVAASINTNTLDLGTALNRITADFNPTPNALRVVTSAADRNNLRISSGGTGALAVDSNLNPVPSGVIQATAYSRNNAGGGTSGATTLYAINGTTNQLVTQGSIDFFTGSGVSPNTGNLTNLAALTGVTGSSIVGFDILNGPGTATSSPGLAFVATNTTLFSLDLSTGAATSLGTIGSGLVIVDIAAVPEPSSLAFASLAIAGLVVGFRRRKRNATSAIL